MPIEWLNLFSVWGFTFFLLILSIWYFVIEVVFYKFDFIRAIFKRYNNNLFDRIITYILVWIITNILYFYTFIFSKALWILADLFNNSGKLANSLSFIWKDNLIWFQIITFSLVYFISLIILLIWIWILSHIIRYNIYEHKKPIFKKSSKK